MKIRLHRLSRTASLEARVRLWWNWQTRYFEVVVGKPVQVQVLLSAPKNLSTQFAYFRARRPLIRGRLALLFRAGKLFVPVLLSLLILTGCARRYRITLNNNHIISTTTKPKLNKRGDAFVFKDGLGKPMALPAGVVKQIEPESHKPVEDPMFKPSR